MGSHGCSDLAPELFSVFVICVFSSSSVLCHQIANFSGKLSSRLTFPSMHELISCRRDFISGVMYDGVL